MKTNPVKTNKKIWLGVAIGFALMLLIISPQPAMAQQWTSAPPNIYYNGGNVGIGTTSPAATDAIAIVGSDSARKSITLQNTNSAGNASLYFQNNRGSYAAYGGLLTGGSADASGNMFGASRADKTILIADGASSLGLSLGTLTAQPLVLGTNNAERVRIDSSGNVGIGKTNPTVALDVVGSINVTGNINAKYQDVAEWVECSEHVPAGTVVVLDPTKSNQVISSTLAYDTRVAGIVSEKPGIALGESGANKVLVATTGRVRVNVDATKSPIHVGDLLVTSDILGVAMKSEPIEIGGRKMHMPGTLIGKALEPLETGSGAILVLLSLQ